MPQTDAIVAGSMFEQAYRMAGALKHPGQGISPSEAKEATLITNMMINGWKIERLLFIYTKRTEVPFYSGKKDYSVGPGQDFDVERVEKFLGVGYVQYPGQVEQNSEIPMMLVVDFQQYQGIIAKLTGSTQPLLLYYKALVPSAIPGNVPYGEATLWPVPNLDGSLAIYTPATLDSFDTPDQIVYMPEGYQEMLTYNLAVRVHQRYPNNSWDGQTVMDMAEFYKQRVKNMQITPILMGSDAGALGGTAHPYWYGFPKTWTPYGS